jgi:hypothetical protein
MLSKTKIAYLFYVGLAHEAAFLPGILIFPRTAFTPTHLPEKFVAHEPQPEILFSPNG